MWRRDCGRGRSAPQNDENLLILVSPETHARDRRWCQDLEPVSLEPVTPESVTPAHTRKDAGHVQAVRLDHHRGTDHRRAGRHGGRGGAGRSRPGSGPGTGHGGLLTEPGPDHRRADPVTVTVCILVAVTVRVAEPQQGLERGLGTSQPRHESPRKRHRLAGTCLRGAERRLPRGICSTGDHRSDHGRPCTASAVPAGAPRIRPVVVYPRLCAELVRPLRGKLTRSSCPRARREIRGGAGRGLDPGPRGQSSSRYPTPRTVRIASAPTLARRYLT